MRSAVMMAKPIEVEKLQTWMGTTYRVFLDLAAQVIAVSPRCPRWCRAVGGALDDAHLGRVADF